MISVTNFESVTQKTTGQTLYCYMLHFVTDIYEKLYIEIQYMRFTLTSHVSRLRVSRCEKPGTNCNSRSMCIFACNTIRNSQISVTRNPRVAASSQHGRNPHACVRVKVPQKPCVASWRVGAANATMRAMASNPLTSATPGRSEFSYGKGRFAHPESDYQSQRAELPFTQGDDSGDLVRKYQMELRSDPTNSEENIDPDMLYSYGNPDMFGPGPKMVQEAKEAPPYLYKQPVYRFGVDRQP